MKNIIVIAILIVVIAIIAFSFKSRRGGSVMGADIPKGMEVSTVAEALALGHDSPGTEVVLKGKMDEKCPTSGCWFYLSDDTARIRVDTQFAGFTVVDYKRGASVTLYGKVIKLEDGEPEISAIGARF